MVSWLTRFKVVLLTAVVLSGGSGLPLLDALLYHTRASEIALGTHIETAGTPPSHAELCTLGRAAPATSPSPRADGGLRVVPVAHRTPATIAPAVRRAVDPPTARHSRAPPSHLV